MAVTYQTRFGSLSRYEKGRVEPITDDARNYAFSNCFEVASRSRPYERVVGAQNQIYVLEVLRAEGTSPWYTCAHDEFALCMDGEVEVHLLKLDASQHVPDAVDWIGPFALGALITLAGVALVVRRAIQRPAAAE